MSRKKRDGRADLAALRAVLDADPRLAWLLRQKVTVPEPVPGYMDRAGLVERAMPTKRRITAIVAPGGFGKTTLLAECCRRLAGEGVTAAWLSIDGDEAGDVLDAYLAFALRYAGLDVGDAPAGEDGAEHAEYGRAARLLRGIEAAAAAVVLALDDLQRLSDPRALALVEFLVRRGPPNLHLAVACRRLPEALDIGGGVLSGTSAALTAGDLRFTSSEIATFFGKTLSRRKLAAVKRDSGGWPMALRIHRNRAQELSAPDEREAREEREIVANWVESRLWEGMDAGDRELLLDAGLFEWMDEDLLAEMLGARDAMRRIESMDALVGLLYPVRHGAKESWRLHPLIREHCARRRLRDDRGRYRQLHRRLAVALAHRGETLQALRHAAESGDAELSGTILEEAGAVRLWIRYGVAAFQAAVGSVEEAVLMSTPRLRLARCAWLLFSGRLMQARLAYIALPAPGPAPDGGPGDPVWVDDRLVQCFLGFYGGESVGSERARAMMADYRAIAASPDVERLVRGFAEHAICVGCNAMGEFDAARDRAGRAMGRLGGNPYGRMLVGFQLGQIAMAQGRVEGARESTTRTRCATRRPASWTTPPRSRSPTCLSANWRWSGTSDRRPRNDSRCPRR